MPLKVKENLQSDQKPISLQQTALINEQEFDLSKVQNLQEILNRINKEAPHQQGEELEEQLIVENLDNKGPTSEPTTNQTTSTNETGSIDQTSSKSNLLADAQQDNNPLEDTMRTDSLFVRSGSLELGLFNLAYNNVASVGSTSSSMLTSNISPSYVLLSYNSLPSSSLMYSLNEPLFYSFHLKKNMLTFMAPHQICLHK